METVLAGWGWSRRLRIGDRTPDSCPLSLSSADLIPGEGLERNWAWLAQQWHSAAPVLPFCPGLPLCPGAKDWQMNSSFQEIGTDFLLPTRPFLPSERGKTVVLGLVSLVGDRGGSNGTKASGPAGSACNEATTAVSSAETLPLPEHG